MLALPDLSCLSESKSRFYHFIKAWFSLPGDKCIMAALGVLLVE